MIDIFAAAESTEKKVAKKDRVTFESQNVETFNKIKDFVSLEEQIKTMEALRDQLKAELKTEAQELFLEQYENSGKYPGTVVLTAENEMGEKAEVQFVPSDKYIKIDKERYDFLAKEFDKDIVDKKVEYGFNTEMLEKYKTVIAKLISETSEIATKDKPKLLTSTTAYSVKKGAIEQLSKYGNVATVFQSIMPVVMLKGAKIVEE